MKQLVGRFPVQIWIEILKTFLSSIEPSPLQVAFLIADVDERDSLTS